MKATVVTDEAAGTAGMTLLERPEPEPALNEVVVRVHAPGFTSGELTWPSTWTDRLAGTGRRRFPGRQLGEIVQRVRDGRLRTNIGNVAPLGDAVAAFNSPKRISGQMIIRVRP